MITDVRRCLFDRTDGWLRNQVRAEVPVERRKRFRSGGQEPEADVAVGTDQDHATRWDAGSGGVEAGVGSDARKLGPTPVHLRERRGVGDGPKTSTWWDVPPSRVQSG